MTSRQRKIRSNGLGSGYNLRFFIQNTATVGNYVYKHNPEGYDYWEALEKLNPDVMSHRWQKIVNDTADLFDVLAKPEEIED